MIFDIATYGADPMGTPTQNAEAIQSAIQDASGKGIVYFSGCYEYGQTISIPKDGLYMRGDGVLASTLMYRGTGAAIALSDQWTSGHSKIHLSNFSLHGTEAASAGIDLTGKSKYLGMIDNVIVYGFSGSGAIGIHLSNVYLFCVSQTIIWNCDTGMKLTETANTIVRECWIKGNYSRHGVHQRSKAGVLRIYDTIIDSTEPIQGQIGLYVETGSCQLTGVHFEDLGQAYRLQSGPIWMSQTTQNSCLNCPTIDDRITVFYDHMKGSLDATMGVSAQLGTIWSHHIGHVLRPTVTEFTSDQLLALSPVILLELSNIDDLDGITTDAARSFDGLVTFVFVNDHCTIRHDNRGGSGGRFLLADNKDWNPSQGSSITFQKAYLSNGIWYFVEIGRRETKGTGTVQNMTRDQPFGLCSAQPSYGGYLTQQDRG